MDKREMIHKILAVFIRECLFNKASGYPQGDDTYSLYRQNYLWLRGLLETTPEQYTSIKDQKYLQLEEKIMKEISLD